MKFKLPRNCHRLGPWNLSYLGTNLINLFWSEFAHSLYEAASFHATEK
jgi:hypothetical protein